MDQPEVVSPSIPFVDGVQPSLPSYQYTFGHEKFLLDYKGCKVFYPCYEILPEIEKFQADESDVVIISFPKTGTTFTAAVVHMIQNNADPKCMTSGEPLEIKIPQVEFTMPGLPVGSRFLDKLTNALPPRTFFTHLNYEATPKSVLAKAKVIYITRNPKDTIVSLHHFMGVQRTVGYRERTLEDTVDSFIENSCIYAPFYDHIADFWASLPKHKNIFFMTYEQLVKDFKNVVRELAKFLGKQLTDEQLNTIITYCNFDAMKENQLTNRTGIAKSGFFDYSKSTFIRKGKIGNWKEHFTPELSAKVDKWIEKEEARLKDKLGGFSFIYE